MTTLADYAKQVGLRVQDDAGRIDEISAKAGTDLKEARVLSAVRTYSIARPLEADELITGDAATQVYPVPTGWSVGFSTLVDFEFPIDEVPSRMVTPLKDQLVLMRRANLDRLGTVRRTLGTGEQARIHFLTMHRVSATEDTIPDVDFDAVLDLAASMVCDSLAAFYAETTLSTLSADNVDHAAKATLFEGMAEMFQERFLKHIAPKLDEAGEAALVMHDVDIPNYRGPRSRYLFARRELR